MDLIYPSPHEPSSKRRTSWIREALEDAERHIALRGTFRESRKPNRYQLSTIIKNEPSSFEEAVKHQVWNDVVNEEYDLIMNNDVWDVVPRP